MRISSKARRGFSLLELLIVVAIILIIATIAIPSLLRSGQAANESAGAANMRSINVAQNAYLSTYHEFATMNTLIADGLLDERYAGLHIDGLCGQRQHRTVRLLFITGLRGSLYHRGGSCSGRTGRPAGRVIATLTVRGFP